MASEHAAVAAAWMPDPSGRHQVRYWDGAVWTDFVSDAGQASVDPLCDVASTPVDKPQGPIESVVDVALGVPGSGGPIDPDLELFGVRAAEWHKDSSTFIQPAGTCRWSDVPEQARALWEASLVGGEVPRIWSCAGMLATDRALLVAERWPRSPSDRWPGTSPRAHDLGTRADRYEFRWLTNLDEGGFDYAGTRRKHRFDRGDGPNAFFWELVWQHPELAPRLVLQPAERGVPGVQTTITIGHEVGSQNLGTSMGPGGERYTRVEHRYATSPVLVVARRDPRFGDATFHQFVDCPVCGVRLRVVNKRRTFSEPGGLSLACATAHAILDDPPG